MTVAPAPAPDDAMSYALRYAGCGLRVVPIAPGKKHPEGLGRWQDAATVDAATITSWWTGLYRGHGVGIALGRIEDLRNTPTYVFAVDIDGASHDVDGEGAWRDVLAKYDATEIETWEAITGGGGRHLIYAADIDLNNGDMFIGFEEEIQTRGSGGQIVVEPTIHPDTGRRYEWLDGHAPWDRPVARAPEWMIEALTEKRRINAAEMAAAALRPQPEAKGDRPGDLWAAQTSWRQILEPDGWTLSHVDAKGEHHWVRPGKEVREGTSATTGYTANDNLKVFTSSLSHMGLRAEETYSKLGYLAATRHNGDYSAAASALAGAGFRVDPLDGWGDVLPSAPTSEGATMTADEPGGWPIATADEIRAVFSGDYQPPMPEILMRNDGLGMLYRSRVNSLAGEPGGGKTWIALHAAAEVLADGGRVVLIDYEDRLDTAVRRLSALGAAQQDIVDRFVYVSPTYAIKGGHVPTNVLGHADHADLAVIDSMGEALAHSELDQNVDQEVRSWIANTARRLADGGAAVLVLDHVTKDAEHRGRWAIGSQRKLAAIDGIAYMMTTLTAATKESEGRAVIKCSKDRLGNYQHGTTVADVRLTPAGEGMRVTLAAPAVEGGEELLTGYMERISRFLEDVGEEMSGRAIEASVSGAGRHIRTALKQLVEVGNVVTVQGKSGAVIHRLDTPFREFDLLETPARPRVPAASPPRPDAVPKHPNRPRPRVPPLEGDADAVEDGGSTTHSHDDPPRPLGDELDDIDFI